MKQSLAAVHSTCWLDGASALLLDLRPLLVFGKLALLRGASLACLVGGLWGGICLIVSGALGVMSGLRPCKCFCLGPVVMFATQRIIPGLEKYNPFDDRKTTSAPVVVAEAALVVMSPARDPRPPPFTPSAQQQINTEQLHHCTVLLFETEADKSQ